MHKLYQLLILALVLVSCGGNEEPLPPVAAIPVVSLDGLSIIEGDDDRAVFVNLRLSAAPEQMVRIFVESEDGTAVAGEDYVSVSETVDIAPGLVQGSIRVEIIGDETFEPDESFSINITNARDLEVGEGTAVITIENDDLGSTVVDIPEGGFTSPTSYEGMELIWSDEFEGEELNEEFWTYEFGNGVFGWGNNELQFYQTENTRMIDGHLVIEARPEVVGGQNFTSSRIITRDKFEFKYGRVDIRAALPEGQGIWPALWMLGANFPEVGWPQSGEIDIMELVGHQPSTVHSTVHYANPNGDRVFMTDSRNLTGGEKFIDNFNVFSIIWEEDRIGFLLNDEEFYHVTPAILGSSNPYPFNEPFFFIMNVAVGGIWPGNPDGTTEFPQHMIVDYIRVFQ